MVCIFAYYRIFGTLITILTVLLRPLLTGVQAAAWLWWLEIINPASFFLFLRINNLCEPVFFGKAEE